MTGVWVGAGLPPSGSGVTITSRIPRRLAGNFSSAVPAEVTLNSTPAGTGALRGAFSHTS
jgi:hypothetical protein